MSCFLRSLLSLFKFYIELSVILNVILVVAVEVAMYEGFSVSNISVL